MIVLQSLGGSPRGCGILAGDTVPGNRRRAFLRALEGRRTCVPVGPGCSICLPHRRFQKSNHSNRNHSSHLGFEQVGKLRKGFATAKAVRPTERGVKEPNGEKNLAKPKVAWRPSERARASQTVFSVLNPKSTPDLACPLRPGNRSFSGAWFLDLSSTVCRLLSPNVGYCRPLPPVLLPAFAPSRHCVKKVKFAKRTQFQKNSKT